MFRHAADRRPDARGWALWPTWADVGLVVALAAGPMGLSLLIPKAEGLRAPDAFAASLALASALALLWRRRAPLPVLAVAATIVVVNAIAGYPVAAVQWPVWIALYTCFAWSAWGPRTMALAITALGVAGYALFNRVPVGPADLASISLSVLVATITGDAIRSRRAQAAAIEARLDSEQRERAMLAEKAAQEERIRWARELHDAVGHGVNVMVMQAGVARRLFAENPAFAREALHHIETVGREALDELDRLLRWKDDAVDDATAADGSAEDLVTLAERVRSTGREIDLVTTAVRLRPSASRALYRIVQEAVTNALKHSEGRIRVDVSQRDALVIVDIHSSGPVVEPPIPGRGLLNMRERARLEGGDFAAGPDENGFRVRATLPGQPPVANLVAP